MTQVLASARQIPKAALAVAAGTAAAYLVFLAELFLRHRWIADPAGLPLAADFLSFWMAGHLAAGGHAAAAYDWSQMHALQRQLMGRSFDGYLGWAYPPLFFCAAIPLAALPYTASFLLWVGVTLALYAAAVAAVARAPGAALLALAAPMALAAAIPGQNGLLTAALIGTALLQLEKRPLLCGVLLGLLTYKPQFGLLLPVALACGGHGRAFLAAAATTALILAASFLFAPQALFAFVQHMGMMTANFLSAGAAGWYKLQSLYGLLRMAGVRDSIAFAAQSLVLAGCAGGVGWLWRARADLALQCAGLCAGTLLATPYLYAYDFPLLVLAMAFLYRQRPFDRAEVVALVIANLLVAAFFVVPAPTCLFAALTVAGVIARRWRISAAA